MRAAVAASRAGPSAAPPLAAVAPGRARAQLGRERQRHPAAAAAVGTVPAASVAANSSAPVSISGWKLAS